MPSFCGAVVPSSNYVGYPTFRFALVNMARILIADDSELIRKHLTAALGSHAGWTVCGEAANGVNAILMAYDLKPDLIILDLVMPMLDGLQAAAEIAKIIPSVPIVIYSLQILPELEMEAKKFGVWALVSKSSPQNLLIETVERLLASSQPTLSPETIDKSVEASRSPSTAFPDDNAPDLDPAPEPPAEPD